MAAGPLLHVRDEKAAGASAGSATSGVWNTRTLNTVSTNEITGASLASNQITLAAGVYFIMASAPAFKSNNHKLRLRNVTDASTTTVGTSAWNQGVSPDAQTIALLSGQFTISTEKTFELQHFFTSGEPNNGLGAGSGDSEISVFAEALIWQVPNNAGSVQTTDATVTELWRLALVAGETATVEAIVNAKKSTGEVYSARIFQTARNVAGITTVGSQNRQEIELGSVTAGIDASLVADDNADTIKLEVSGAAAETWEWSANMRVVKQ